MTQIIIQQLDRYLCYFSIFGVIYITLLAILTESKSVQSNSLQSNFNCTLTWLFSQTPSHTLDPFTTSPPERISTTTTTATTTKVSIVEVSDNIVPTLSYEVNLYKNRSNGSTWTRLFPNPGDELDPAPNRPEVLHILSAACKMPKRCTELVRMVHTYYIYHENDAHLHFHIVIDEKCDHIRERLDLYRSSTIKVTVYTPEDLFPSMDRIPNKGWLMDKKRAFHHDYVCINIRLLAAKIDQFSDIDYVMWQDCDTLVTAPFTSIHKVWDGIRTRNFIAGLIPEDFGKIQYGSLDRNFSISNPPYGVNSGVFFMNLKLMREQNWIEDFLTTCKERDDYYLPDQDMLNYYFSMHPDKLLLVNCEYNWRYQMEEDCMLTPVIVHGANFWFYRSDWWKKLMDLADNNDTKGLSDWMYQLTSDYQYHSTGVIGW